DDPALPRVLLIGDSISMGYTLPVRALLKGKANVHRIPENGGPTSRGVQRLSEWLGDKPWDVIHFNWGLHDIKMDEEGKHHVPIDQYEQNLRKLVAQLKATGARLIWASTTPVPDAKVSPPRSNDDVLAYNAVATKIMDENGIAIDDLYAVALPRLAELQRPANVHFTPHGSEVLAKQVAASIGAALSESKPPPE
ncbi:MAG: SGNH/GDSL hydrolase family protein, partial [Armatimonadota bacterium]